MGQQRTEHARYECRRKVIEVGVDPAHEIAGGDGETLPERLPLPAATSAPGQDRIILVDRRPGVPRNPGGVVAGVRVDHHELIDERELVDPVVPDARQDRPDGVGHVERGKAHAHRGARGALGGQQALGVKLGTGEGALDQPLVVSHVRRR